MKKTRIQCSIVDIEKNIVKILTYIECNLIPTSNYEQSLCSIKIVRGGFNKKKPIFLMPPCLLFGDHYHILPNPNMT